MTCQQCNTSERSKEQSQQACGILPRAIVPCRALSAQGLRGARAESLEFNPDASSRRTDKRPRSPALLSRGVETNSQPAGTNTPVPHADVGSIEHDAGLRIFRRPTFVQWYGYVTSVRTRLASALIPAPEKHSPLENKLNIKTPNGSRHIFQVSTRPGVRFMESLTRTSAAIITFTSV